MFSFLRFVTFLPFLCFSCTLTNSQEPGFDASDDVNVIENPNAWKFAVNASSGAPCFATTDCGTVEGRVSKNVFVFKGIPYAKPPVGERRWKPPVSLKESGSCWSGTLQALKFGHECVQDHPSQGVIGDEDCLHLNIYTPTLNQHANLPVMFWIHGGYLMWSSNHEADYYPDETTVHDTNMVYVNLNYRLNGFGFLALDILSELSETHTSGNFGFMDQILGLKWVRDNIRNFGGNPDLVTLFGQSSGGTSTWALSVSPLAKGLFHRAWMISASPLFEITLEQASIANQVFLERSNCSDTECIYSLTPEQVIKANPTDVYPYWGSPNSCDLPVKDFKDGALCVIDGIIIPHDPLTVWKNGEGNDVPLVLGTTAQEIDYLPRDTSLRYWTWEKYRSHVADRLDPFGKDVTSQAMALYPYDESKDTPEFMLTTMASDILLHCGSDIIAKVAAESYQSPVYRYVATSWPSTQVSFMGFSWEPKYAFHLWDIFSFFGFVPRYVSNPTEEDMAFQKIMQKAIAHFAREGVMPPDMKWPTVPTGVALLDSTVEAHENYHAQECKFWVENGFYAYSWIN
ncbi:para-nitrobenzyl esterase-like [Glandiceps talaboti]